MRTAAWKYEDTTASELNAGRMPARAERFPWLPVLVLGFTWFLAVAIELSPAGLLGAIAADLNVSGGTKRFATHTPR